MALQLYRRILRAARQFDPETRQAIQAEASTLFRQNASITDPDQIAAKLFEGTTRLELAQHYKLAAPRLYNVMPATFPAGKRDKPRRKPQPVPAYMDSYYEKRNPNPKP